MTKIMKGSSAFKRIQDFKRENQIIHHSMLELIVLFCEEHELDPSEFGEELKADKNFKDMFKADLLFHHEAVFYGNKPQDNLSEWC